MNDRTKEQTGTTVWVSALIPQNGADTYDGVRVAVFFTEEDCYHDLADWLEIEYSTKEATIEALDDACDDDDTGYGIRTWKVEEQQIFQESTQARLFNLLQSDIYTDAPEYADRVAEIHRLLPLALR